MQGFSDELQKLAAAVPTTLRDFFRKNRQVAYARHLPRLRKVLQAITKRLP